MYFGEPQGRPKKTSQKILRKKKIGENRVGMVCRATPTPLD
jgi:hypothetical protein